MHNKDSKELEPFKKLSSSLPIAIPLSLGRRAGVFGRSVGADDSPPDSSRSVHSDEEESSEFGSALLKEMDSKGLNTEIREELEQYKIHALFNYIPDQLQDIFSYYEQLGTASTSLSTAHCYDFELFYQAWQLNSDLALCDLSANKIKVLVEKLGANPNYKFNIPALESAMQIQYTYKNGVNFSTAYEIVQKKGFVSWASYLASRGDDFEMSFT